MIQKIIIIIAGSLGLQSFYFLSLLRSKKVKIKIDLKNREN